MIATDDDGWRADIGRGGLRLVALRAALVACFLLALVGMACLHGGPAPVELAAGAASVTLAGGVLLAGVAETAARRRRWPVQRGCDLIIVVSTLSAACAAAQFTYASAALQGGPQAGYAALSAVATPESSGSVLLGSFLYWGLPCGLMTIEGPDLRDIWRRHPALAVMSVITCFGGAAGVLLLTASYHLAARLEARFAAAPEPSS